MSPDTNSSWEALVSYFFGALSDAERAELEQRLSADPASAAQIARLRRALEATRPSLDGVDAPAALARLQQRVASQHASRSTGSVRRSALWRSVSGGMLPRRFWPAVAAVGLLLVGVMLVRPPVHREPGSRRGPRVSATVTYRTGHGELQSFTLPDGSTVALGEASRLDVPRDFRVRGQPLVLDGAAVFTVRHQPEHPFAVHVSGGVVQVLGTMFFMRRYAADTALLVGVRDGKISVRAGGVSTLVVPASGLVRVGVGGVQPVPEDQLTSDEKNSMAGLYDLTVMAAASATPGPLPSLPSVRARVPDALHRSVSVMAKPDTGSYVGWAAIRKQCAWIAWTVHLVDSETGQGIPGPLIEVVYGNDSHDSRVPGTTDSAGRFTLKLAVGDIRKEKYTMVSIEVPSHKRGFLALGGNEDISFKVLPGTQQGCQALPPHELTLPLSKL